MLDRYKGCIIGAAIGDAFGMPYEFKPRGSFKCSEEMIGGGVFKLPKGYYTDDASQILCLAQSIIENDGEFDRLDFMQKLRDWYIDGYMSSTGKFIDIGNQTRIVLDQYDHDKTFISMDDESQSGNGSLMRIAPIALVYNGRNIDHCAKESSKVTHASELCLKLCAKYSILIKMALHGMQKSTIQHASDFNLKDGEFGSSGYVLDSYNTALYSFFNTNSFKECIMMAVDFGEDTDTNACIAGMLAGAYYGIDGIPSEWKESLKDYDKFESVANNLFDIKE